MSNKVVPSHSTHGDSHPSLYKGNHRDYYFSLLPQGMPLPPTTIPNGNPRRNLVAGFKAINTSKVSTKLANLLI